MTDDVMDEYERLLPALIEAGYVESDDDTWSYTPKGIERVEELGLDQKRESFTREDFLSDLRKVSKSEADA